MARRYPEAVEACRRRFALGEAVTAGAASIAAHLGDTGFSPSPVITTDGRAITLDLSAGSTLLGADSCGADMTALGELIDAAMRKHGTGFAFGRWGEHRALYSNEHFSAGRDDRRTIHMGIDLFCSAMTEVRAPLDGVVEFTANNARELDYGPMLVLRHAVPGNGDFFTLYGHLDRSCTTALRAGQRIAAGDVIAAVGRPPGNGNWPPHLHFQLILDLLGLDADFPGVADRAGQDFWLALSPHPAPFFPEMDAAGLDGRSDGTRRKSD